jgi:hypothetical protein
MTEEEGVDAFRMEDVVAWELAHLCFVDFKIVHADWTCRLRPRGRHARCRYCGCRRVAGQRSPLVASFGIYSGLQKPECLIRHMWCGGFLGLVGSSRSSIGMYWKFVKDLLRDSQALDTQRFEVDLAVENALAEVVAPSSLDNVHDEGSDADCDK